MSYVDELEARLAHVEPAECGYPEPDAPIWLTGTDTAEARAHCRGQRACSGSLGLLVQPGNGTHARVAAYPWLGIDNGCFAKGDRFDTDVWLRYVEQLAAQHDVRQRCLFAAAPDVVGDWRATWERSRRPLALIRKLGLPAALVAQDGLTVRRTPWGEFDALFIGGSTEWKLSEHAAKLSAEARRRGLWVHVGRVNSWKRLVAVRDNHADSADGTFLAFGPKRLWPHVESWASRLAADALPATGLPIDPRSPTVVHPPSHFDYQTPTLLSA